MSKRRQVNMPVKAFVALDEPAGSLNFTNNILAEGRAKKGQHLHSSIQFRLSQEYPDFQSEVSLAHLFKLKQIDLYLSGRVDGIFNDLKMVEEIKSTAFYKNILKEYQKTPFHPHIMQLKLYALMLHEKNGEVYDLHIRLVNQYDSEEQTIVPIEWTPEEVRQWISQHEQILLEQENKSIANKARRSHVSDNMRFPFPSFRSQQQALMKITGEIFEMKGQALIQAPTGMGKTASTLYPALLSSLQKDKTLFYLTPKNSQHAEAQKFVRKLQEQGSDIVSTTLTSKEKICFKDECICQPEYCEYAKDYFDKISRSQVIPRLKEEKMLDRHHFEEYGKMYQVCPFELSLELSLESDIIISDYNYVFAPNAALQRFFDDPENAHQCNILIDEAHNLYQRAMDYFSPQISLSMIDDFAQDVSKVQANFHEKFFTFLGELRKFIESPEHERQFGTQQGIGILIDIVPQELYKLEKRMTLALAQYVQEVKLLRPSDPFLKLQACISEFATILRAQSEAIICSLFEDGDDKGLQLTCADASPYLKDIHNKCNSSVAFSATLKPFDFYRDLCGFDKEKVMYYEFQSPFPKENRKLFILPQVSTTYAKRHFYMQSIAQQILEAFQLKLGNYLIFFPSFAFLQAMEQLLRHPAFLTLSQEAEMNNEQRQYMMEQIQDTSQPKIILAVQGGIFSEGVDFPGEQVIGTAIIGPGLPAFTCERKALREYYEKYYQAGQEYAYIYPAMCKVIQSAGRVIRTETDTGVILLFDRRFLESKYVQTYPTEWYEHAVKELLSDQVLTDIKNFWDSN